MAYYAGVDRPEVGLVEFVQTAEAHRRKGGSSALMEELVKDFKVLERWDGIVPVYCQSACWKFVRGKWVWQLVGGGMLYLALAAEDWSIFRPVGKGRCARRRGGIGGVCGDGQFYE